MKEMLLHLKTLVDLCHGEGIIVRFHSLENVIPWKLDVDVKCHEVLLKKLAQSSLWQLVSLRIKQHSLQQSKLADQLQQALRGEESDAVDESMSANHHADQQ